jgi:hypothetical protein
MRAVLRQVWPPPQEKEEVDTRQRIRSNQLPYVVKVHNSSIELTYDITMMGIMVVAISYKNRTSKVFGVNNIRLDDHEFIELAIYNHIGSRYLLDLIKEHTPVITRGS